MIPNTQLGRMGNSGSSTGLHLHFETQVGGIAVDPAIYLGTKPQKLTPEEQAVCEEGGSGGDAQNPFGKYNSADDLPGEKLIKFKIDRNNKITGKSVEPAPVITYVDTLNEGNLKVYGLGIYKNMKLNFESYLETCAEYNWWPNDKDCKRWEYKKENIQEQDKTESIEHAQIIFTKNTQDGQEIASFWNDPPFEPGKEGRFTKDGFSIPNTLNYGDKICVKSRLFGNLNYRGKDYNENGQLEVFGGCYTLIKEEYRNIELPIDVNESNVDKTRDQSRSGVNYDDLKVNLKLTGDSSKYADSYPAGKDIWIVTHGYDDQILTADKKSMKSDDRFTKIANNIQKENPDAIVMVLDWSDAADGKANGAGNATDKNRDTCRAATWIRRVSEGVEGKLRKWGVDDGRKIHLVGHSLGTIMITEISKRFSRQALGIALDPPSEALCPFNVQGVYNYGHKWGSPEEFTNGEYRSNYGGNFRFVRAIVGSRSIAGNQVFARTADESIEMAFSNDHWDTGEQHGWVVESFRRLIKTAESDILLDEKVLSGQDKAKHWNWQREKDCGNCSNKTPYNEHNGRLVADEPDNVKELRVSINNEEKIYYKK